MSVTDNNPPPPAPNTPEAREPDGTLKDQNPTGSVTGSEQNQNDGSKTGQSFLNTPEEKPEEKKPEAKEGDAPPPEKKEGEGETPPEGAPEKYEAFKLPEGYEFDKDSLTSAQALFKELNLPQASAQKLVDMYVKNGVEAAEAPFK